MWTRSHALQSSNIDLWYTLGLWEQFERDRCISHIHDIIDVQALALAQEGL